MKKISFIMPSRNGKKYLEWAYNSIRKNLNSDHEICMYDDASTDGTWKYMNELKEKDKNIQIFRNEGPERVGHTISYDFLIEKSKNEICMIFHNDMYACPGLDEEILKYIKPGIVISATRIEPPLHPEGPEKLISDFGIEPHEFDEEKLLEYVIEKKKEFGNKVTEGIFAPWAIYKKDFNFVGGHDPLFAPQSKEDSCIFNRFSLAGYNFIQSWNGFVYHLTCRGSRFANGAKRNPDGRVFMKGRETDEWLKQNQKSTRNFIRKWKTTVQHDQYLKPIVDPIYDIGFNVRNCHIQLLEILEPFCNNIKCDITQEEKNIYLEHEQPNTKFNLDKKIVLDKELNNEIIISFDGQLLNNDNFKTLTILGKIISDSGSIGKFNLDIFEFNIKKMNTYEKNLIKLDNSLYL